MMSEPRITQLEKDMAVMQSTVTPLLPKIEASTEAMTALTYQIKSLVTSNDNNAKAMAKLEAVTVINTNKLTKLETAEAVRASRGKVWEWIERTVWVSVAGVILKASGVI